MMTPPATSKTVMVVDDSRTIRELIRQELLGGGYEVVDFPDGIEALSALVWMPSPPDMLTLDIDMPRMDGLSLCHEIRQREKAGTLRHPRFSRLPVLFVSANETMEHRRRGFELESLDFIAKPFRKGQILAAVDKVLRPESSFQGMTALVVDDDPLVRSLVLQEFARLGLHGHTAPDGVQGYELITRLGAGLDLLVTDFEMPSMRGDELCHLVRQKRDALGTLPIIFISGENELAAVLAMFRAGASDYLQKPFIAEVFRARLGVHLALRQQLKQLEACNLDLSRQAYYDSLTGLSNRRHFLEQFDLLLSTCQRSGLDLACFFCDLDHFKRVNDVWGHDCGDMVLRQFSAILAAQAQQGEIVARYGGEEFVAVLPAVSPAQAVDRADTLRCQVSASRFLVTGEETVPVTVSIGVACISQGLDSIEDLLRGADEALYQAKKTGRNQVVLHGKA